MVFVSHSSTHSLVRSHSVRPLHKIVFIKFNLIYLYTKWFRPLYFIISTSISMHQCQKSFIYIIIFNYELLHCSLNITSHMQIRFMQLVINNLDILETVMLKFHQTGVQCFSTTFLFKKSKIGCTAPRVESRIVREKKIVFKFKILEGGLLLCNWCSVKNERVKATRKKISSLHIKSSLKNIYVTKKRFYKRWTWTQCM